MTRDEYMARFRATADAHGFPTGHPQRGQLVLMLACDELAYRDRQIERLCEEYGDVLGLPPDSAAAAHSGVPSPGRDRVGVVEAEHRFAERAERHSHGEARASRR